MQLVLPAQLNSEAVLELLANLGELDCAPDPIQIDFSKLSRITPAGLTAIAASVTRWRRERREIELTSLETCRILPYLQRMDLLRNLGIDMSEEFQRHESHGRFVPIRLIDHQVDSMGEEMALCLAPGGDDYDHPLAGVYDLVWYALTEVANNARQHSEGLGFVSAQVTQKEGLIRLAIADNGRGVRASFIDSGLKWAEKLTDSEAILRALEPKVSSKGQPTNEGVGLTLVAKIAELAKAWLLVASGSGVVNISKGTSVQLKPVEPQLVKFHGRQCF